MIAKGADTRTLGERTIFAFDVETTGLDPAEDRIVQIGGVYLNRGVRIGPRRSSLVNPGVPIPNEVTEIHGITDAHVKDSPGFAVVGASFVDCVRQGPGFDEPLLCGYNAPGFDVPFINAELNRHGIAYRIDPTRVLDPLVFVRWHHRDWRARNLQAAAKRYGYNIKRSHFAAEDAEAAALILWRMTEDGLIPSRLDHALADQQRLAALLEEEWRRFGFAVYLDRNDGRPRIGFGAHSGTLLREVNREYLGWCLRAINELTDEARAMMEEALR